MSTTARTNVWHALSLELGRAVAEDLLAENDPCAPPVLRRLDIARRAGRG
jgi:hypothetical protein